MKVILGKNSESGNVFMLPAQSNDINNDMILPRYPNEREASEID
jgi:hypothetical protein